jgi:hypothetical protein
VSGQPNFLNAINWFFLGGSPDSHKRKGSNASPYIEVEFDDVQDALLEDFRIDENLELAHLS